MRRFLLPILFPFLSIIAAACAGESITPSVVLPSAAAATPSMSPSFVPTAGSSCIPGFARREKARVTKVTDGDSIEVEMNGAPFRVRYIGMNAPEMTGEPFAEKALAANRALVEGKQVILVRDLSEADRYGRLLRFVFADGVFVNREMVRLGMARARVYPPDTACDADFQKAEETAQQTSLGLWEGQSVSGTQVPGLGIDVGCANGCATPPAGCVIKGNINAEGVKIYHLPNGRFYAQTLVEPEKGERWFCSEEEAVAAGWRRSKQ